MTLDADSQRRWQQGSSSEFQLHQNSLQNCIKKSNNKQTQTDGFASGSLKRSQNSLSGKYSGIFCKIMGMFLSGYGNLSVDSYVLSVRKVLVEKIKLWKKLFQLSRVLVQR